MIHPEPRAGSSPVRQRDLPGVRSFFQNETGGRADRCVGEGGQRRGDFHHVPHPAEVGERRQQRQVLPPAPKRAHQPGLILCPPRILGRVDDPAQAFPGFGREQRHKPGGIVEDQSAEER